jgi:hypothetical protein
LKASRRNRTAHNIVLAKAGVNTLLIQKPSLPAFANTFTLAAIQRLKILIAILFLSISQGCEESENRIPKVQDIYQISFRPAFDESSKITVIQQGDSAVIEFLMFKVHSGDDPIDTIWSHSQHISTLHYSAFHSEVLARISTERFGREKAVRDGISISFLRLGSRDTAMSHLRNPNKSTDSLGYSFTKTALRHLKSFSTDQRLQKHYSIVDSYLK